ncbi:hypothetical protein BKA70DRAFT_1217373 [Coprinopsis sp. MPI-PUGE-AT-0042]|nr:hypothetical protein BKA70DRAFT_1217373 [Coprinopsis sp. MPI-PUGE-AT-0042]
MVHSPSVPAARTKRARAPTSSDTASAKHPHGEGEDVSDEDVPHVPFSWPCPVSFLARCTRPCLTHSQRSRGPVDAALPGPSTTLKKDKKKKKKKSLDDESIWVPRACTAVMLLVVTVAWGKAPIVMGMRRWLPAMGKRALGDSTWTPPGVPPCPEDTTIAVKPLKFGIFQLPQDSCRTPAGLHTNYSDGGTIVT